MLVLPNPVGTVDRLGLGRGVPPRVEEEDIVGLGQGQPEPAGLERHEEHRPLARPERRDGLLALAGAPVEVGIADPLGIQPRSDRREEPGELAEHQGLMPLSEHRGEQLEQRIDLGRPDPRMGRVVEHRVEAQPPHPGERPQDGDPVALGIVQEPEDPLPLVGEHPVIDPAMFGRERDLDDLLLLGGQLAGHRVLGAPQHDRPDPPPQRVEALRRGAALDRPPEVLGKRGRPREQPRRDDRQQRPQLHEVVLHGRAGDGEFGPGRQQPRALIDLRLVVLDELRLVEHERRPRAFPEGVGVDAEHGIRRHHEVGPRDGLGDAAAAALGRLAERDHPQRRREPRGLGEPGRQHRGGGHHQERGVCRPLTSRARRALCVGRLLAVLHRAQDHREGLHRLAQTHVVGEDAAEPGPAQEGQPLVAAVLVVP